MRDNGDSWDYSFSDTANGVRFTSTTEIDSNNSDAWNTQTSYYTADGSGVQELDTVNDDLTQTKTYYDVAGGPWAGSYLVEYTNYVSTDGQIRRQTGLLDDGNRWDHRWENGHGNPGAFSYGTIDSANLDPNKASYRDYYNASRQYIRATGVRDNGDTYDYSYNPVSGAVTSTTEIDSNNSDAWSTQTNTYNGTGSAIIRQDTVFDNGDIAAWTWQNGFGNAGTSEHIDWDVSGSKPWWQQTADYNAASQLSRFETIFDDRSKSVDSFSNDANAGWTQRTQLFDAAGALTRSTQI